MDARENLFFITSSLAIVTYTALALHVITRSYRRKISWVFGGLCFLVVNYYFSSLYLFPECYPDKTIIPLALRWKWMIGSFTPAIFLHLVSFYFSPKWRQTVSYLIKVAYGLGVGFAYTALFTDLLIEAPLFRPSPEIIGPIPGPLLKFLLLLLGLSFFGGATGLLAGYRSANLPTQRRQIKFLLTPVLLLILVGVIYSIIILTKNSQLIPHEIGDVLLISIGFLYAKALTDYGTFVGRPYEQRSLLYAISTTLAVFLGTLIFMQIDEKLSKYSIFPYPIITGLYLFVVLTLAPTGYPWLKKRLNKAFPYQDDHFQGMALKHLEKISIAANPWQMQEELLQMLCDAIGTHGGYIAERVAPLSTNALIVRITYGEIPVSAGDSIPMLTLHSLQPQLISALDTQDHLEMDRQKIALLCPLNEDGQTTGILALSEKRDQTRFTESEIALCATLINQVTTTIHLRHDEGAKESNGSSTGTTWSLQALEQDIIDSLNQILIEHENYIEPLLISILGPMIVSRAGKLIEESEWESERAKVMLAYLLWKGDTGATRDELSEALWPGRSMDETANVFHVTLHRLRRALEPGLKKMRDSQYIHHQNGKYCFNTRSPHQLDITIFEDLVKSNNPETLIEAISLYRGSYLEDTIWALPPDVEIQRRSYELIYIDALRRLIPALDRKQAEPYLLRLNALDPFELKSEF